MTYTLFIDDERFPVDTNSVIARSSEEAIATVKDRGMPSHIDFDHDLGGADTSIRFICWMVESLLDGELHFPEVFTFAVHSQNPVGKRNITDIMDGIIAEFMKD